MDQDQAFVAIEDAIINHSAHLVIRNAGLDSLPKSIGRATELRTLDISGNRLIDLPPELANLKSLERLYLSGNCFTDFPEAVTRLTNLVVLDLSHNRVQKLSLRNSSFGRLSKLNLSNNDLSQLPHYIGELRQLKELNLSDNRLDSLPRSMLRMSRLSVLSLHKNSEVAMPPEILRQSAHDILAFYFQTRDRESGRLNEAKMIIVGEGEVGKTSLVKQLLNEDFDPREAMTHGIERSNLKVASQGEEISLNVWDFGGQEVMHATHQFFLTKRSLYLLVVDSRHNEQQSRVEYWLKLIQSYADDSPILVICNKCDQREMDLDWSGLRRKYPRLKGFAKRVSCVSASGITDVRDLIEREVSLLEHVSDAFPQEWCKVKMQLERLQESYISYERYKSLCKSLGVSGENQQRRLIAFLHDLGVVLHFHDHPILRDTNILNPEWVTRGVYAVINCNDLFKSRGVLDIEDLSTILAADEYPPEMHLFLIQMMRRFELCFDFEGYAGSRVLIPDLLPNESPDTGDWSEGLAFEYRYDVLPQSVMSRFIVRMHSHISQSTYWRKGVVLNSMDGENRALVFADFEEASVTILVTGDVYGRAALRDSIRSQFYEIHRTIPGIGADEFVPVRLYSKVRIRYERLIALRDRGLKSEFVSEIGQSLPISELLDGVSTALEREELARRRRLNSLLDDDVSEPQPRGIIESYGRRLPWGAVAGICGGGFFMLMVLLSFLSGVYWKAAVVGSVVVSVVVLSRNPEFFFRRILSATIISGLLLNAAAVGLHIFGRSPNATIQFHWDNQLAWSFNICWLGVIVVLAVRDYLHSRSNSQNRT